MACSESDIRAQPRAHNDHNVYILGAGFAAEAGLPLIKEFMNRMRDAAAWLEAQGGRGREVTAIERVLDFRLRAAAAAYRIPLDVENIEQLFSLASASGDPELDDAMPLAIAATLDYALADERSKEKRTEELRPFQIGVRQPPDWQPPASWEERAQRIGDLVGRAGGLTGRLYSCSPYDFYVGVMAGFFNRGEPDRRDTIVTFNYDTVVEDTLDSLRLPFSYGAERYIGWSTPSALMRAQRARSGMRVLKLHGSINWCAREKVSAGTEEKLAAAPQSVVERMNRDVAAFPHYADVPKQKGALVLVAPTWQKALRRLTPVWDAAVAALRTATNLIILGYSIPVTDQHFKYLLAAGLRDNISLRKVFFVNPALKDERERQTLEARLFGPSGLFRPEHREQGVIELISADTREFFTGPHDISAGEPYRVRIGRPLNPLTYTQENAPFRFSDRQFSEAWR